MSKNNNRRRLITLNDFGFKQTTLLQNLIRRLNMATSYSDFLNLLSIYEKINIYLRKSYYLFTFFQYDSHQIFPSFDDGFHSVL